MINNLNNLQIQTLSLNIPGCNLSCKYCNIAKIKNFLRDEDSHLLENTLEALENGTFLNNSLKVLERLNVSPKKIKRFEIWGGEPTLSFKNLSEHWEEWQEYYSNISSIEFSTNGIGCVDDIYNFIVKVSQTAKHPITFDIQYSYDGKYGVENARGFSDSEKILNNLLYLINKLNIINLKNIYVNFHFHSVISTILLEELNDLEKIELFLNEYEKDYLKIKNEIYNKNIQFTGVDFIQQNAGDFTTEDGFKYYKFLKSLTLLHKKNIYKFLDKEYIIKSFIVNTGFGSMGEDSVQELLNSNFNSFNDYIDYYLENYQNYKNYGTMCGSVLGVLRLSYDGVIYDCHSSMYDNHLDKNKLNNDIFSQASYSCYAHNRYLNFITATDEEIEKLIDFYTLTQSSSTFLFMYQTIVDLMILMSLNGQIDPSYISDLNKIKKHAFILAKFNQCYHNLKVRNGSIYLRGTEEIRQYCNGFLDIVENFINEQISEINND